MCLKSWFTKGSSEIGKLRADCKRVRELRAQLSRSGRLKEKSIAAKEVIDALKDSGIHIVAKLLLTDVKDEFLADAEILRYESAKAQGVKGEVLVQSIEAEAKGKIPLAIKFYEQEAAKLYGLAMELERKAKKLQDEYVQAAPLVRRAAELKQLIGSNKSLAGRIVHWEELKALLERKISVAARMEMTSYPEARQWVKEWKDCVEALANGVMIDELFEQTEAKMERRIFEQIAGINHEIKLGKEPQSGLANSLDG